MSNLLLHMMTFIWAKETDNAKFVLEFAAIWQAFNVICGCI